MKGIDFNEVFSVSMKMMKKLKLCAGSTGIDFKLVGYIEDLISLWTGRGDYWGARMNQVEPTLE